MAKTFTIVTMDFMDVTAKQDSIYTTSFNKEFAILEDLNKEGADIEDYATLERNYVVLDGESKHFPDISKSIPFGFFSSIQSDKNGLFDTELKLTNNFTQNHSSAGITLTFLNEYPKKIMVKWWSHTALLEKQVFEPDSLYFFCDCNVTNFNRVEIIFLETFFPFRNIKVSNIDYGTVLVWKDTDVVEATVTEEVDPISSNLSINTAKLKIFSKDDMFNIVNPKGKYTLLQRKQEVLIEEYKDNEIINMGTFFLDKWSTLDKSQVQFECIDIIGMLDQTDFKKGKVYNGETLESVVEDIMLSAGWSKYEIEERLKEKKVYGYIGVCTHREALQQVAFSVGAVVDDSRSNNIKIYKVRRSLVATINKDRKFTGSKISLRNFVSEVAITIHKYTKGMTEEKLFSGQLHKGRNEVIFKEPCQVTKGVGCTILEKSTNYAIVQVETAQECTINGYKYTDQSSIYTTLIDKMPSGELPNAIKVTDATLVTMDNVGEIARNLLDYYSLRQVSNIKYLIRDEKVGTWTALQSQFGETFAGCLEKQTINLTGGFISNAEIVGYDRELINYDYMPEFNAGEEMGLF